LEEEPNPFEQSFSKPPGVYCFILFLFRESHAHENLAALKCRQRKKQWLQNLQAKVEYLTTDNEQLQVQTNALREQLIDLKTVLLAHKTCP
ncbi:hypothetical protein BJV82DRAFT_492212, partial [Fennellomyces sp. T-0311]